jgi:hypothetical protein
MLDHLNLFLVSLFLMPKKCLKIQILSSDFLYFFMRNLQVTKNKQKLISINFLRGIQKTKKVKRLTMSIVTVSEASTGVTMVVTASRTKVQWIFWSAMSRLAADKPPVASWKIIRSLIQFDITN